jgi:hypothetical protein
MAASPSYGTASTPTHLWATTLGRRWRGPFAATEAGNCALQGSIATPGNAAIVAGPIVFQNGGHDEVYVVTASAATNQLLRYTYVQANPSPFNRIDSVNLPFANAAGMAVDQTSIPARVAITFAGGSVAEYNIPSNYDPVLAAQTPAPIGPGFAKAPGWCSCPTGSQIAVAGLDGTLSLLDINLNVTASYATGSPIRTTPASDGVGEWFFGADDGYLYEGQQPPGLSTMVQVKRYGSLGGPVRSSVQVGSCPIGICVYLGVSNSSAYIIPLNARQATIVACLSNLPPTCSGSNPRLWAQAESGVVGVVGSPQTVHVQGWSYYSS